MLFDNHNIVPKRRHARVHLQVDQGGSALQSMADRSAGNRNRDFHIKTASRDV